MKIGLPGFVLLLGLVAPFCVGCGSRNASEQQVLSRKICEINTFGASTSQKCMCKISILGDEFGSEKLVELLSRMNSQPTAVSELFLLEIAVEDTEAAKRSAARNSEECEG